MTEQTKADIRAKSIEYQGPKFSGQFKELTGKIDQAKADQQTGKTSPLDVLEAETALEEFVGEHDNAGAWRSDKFGSDLSERMDAREMEEKKAKEQATEEERKKIEEKENRGMLNEVESDKRSAYFIVSITELDRINKEGGGHEAGDKAVSKTVEIIEKTVRSQLQAAGIPEAELNSIYDIYRLRGGDFSVRLRLPESVKDMDTVRESIAKSIRENPPDVLADRPPLTAVSIRQDQAVDVFNRIQTSLKENRAVGKDIKRLCIEVIKRSVEYQSEVQRLETNAERVLEKKRQNDPKAEAFFKEYIAKMFEGTDLASFEAYQEDDPDIMKKIRAIANAIISERFARERETAKTTERAIFDEIAGKPVEEKPLTEEEKQKRSEERKKLDALPKLATEELQKREKAGAQTEGNTELTNFRNELEAAKTALEADPTNVVLLKSAIDHFGNFPKEISFDLSNATEAQKALRILERKFRIASNRIDRLSGLPNRGEYFKDLTALHREAETNKTDLRLGFVDMAFLKYMNQQGGRDIGNHAIRTASEIMEAAIQRAGLQGKARAYRYGGDEFTILVSGEREVEENLKNALNYIREEQGAIPRSDQSTDLYRPELLQFNIGFADRDITNRVLQTLIEKNAVDRGRFETDQEYRLKQLSDIQTRIADRNIARGKALERLRLLFDKIQEPAFADRSSLERAQTESLIKYSAKAVFEMNADALLDLLQQTGGDETKLRQFVDQKLALEQEKEAHRTEVRDLVIENYSQAAKYEEVIKDLQKRIDEATEDTTLLKKERDEARQQLAGIVAAREKIQAIPQTKA